MSILSIILVVLTALECFYIMYLETIVTDSKNTSRVFNIPQEELKGNTVKTLFKNQGIYNGLLGVVLLYATLFSENAIEISAIILVYIFICALYGGFTSQKSIILKQGGLPILALLSLFF
ncbi:DUF1304 domain-containing protein [Carnobacteriaceae bacterium zg-ZUI78]|nr:DUF1304 domain-containing protein [Carnobacteriaceae bacterium zg-ZUI78]